MLDNREFHFENCISVCFHDDAHNHIVTLENYQYSTHELLQVDFGRLRDEFGEADTDIMVDLYIDYDLHDTFLIRRQLLDRMRAAVRGGRVDQISVAA